MSGPSTHSHLGYINHLGVITRLESTTGTDSLDIPRDTRQSALLAITRQVMLTLDCKFRWSVISLDPSNQYWVAYLGHAVALDSFTRETDLEDLVHLRSKRSSTRGDVFNITTEQVSDLIVSDPFDWCGD